MAFDAEKFASESSKKARVRGKQYFNYDSGTDLLSVVLASGHFDSVWEKLTAGDVINVLHPLGLATIEVAAITAEVVTTNLISGGEKGTQAITNSGAIDIVTRRTNVTTAASGAMTLADGDYVGQKKDITFVVDGAVDAVITPTTLLGASTITMADAGDSVSLEWSALGWIILGQGGLGTGPVVA